MSPTRSTSGRRFAVSAFGAASRRTIFVSSPKLLAEAEPEVERHADHERDVGPLQPGAAGAAEAELVVGGQAAAAEAVEEDRDAERLGQRPQLAPRPGPSRGRCRPSSTGRSAPASSAAASSTPSAGAAPPGSGGRRRSRLRLAEDDVERVVDEGRPEGAASARSSAAAVRAAICAVAFTVSRRLDQRRDEGQVVDLLQRARAPAHLRRPAAEHADRRAVRLGAGDRADPVGDAGPGGQRRDPDPAGRLGEALGGEGRGLLVADVDDLDALLLAAVVDREEVPAGEREEVRDAPRLQDLGDDPPPVLRPSARSLYLLRRPGASEARTQDVASRRSRPLVPGAGFEPASPIRGSAF